MTRNTIPTNTATRYEVALIRSGKVLKILGYFAKKTKSTLFSAPQGQDLTEYFTEEELDSDLRYTKLHGIQFGDGSIRIAFTGNTERTVNTLAG
jgi:hypothetical protein